MRNASMLFGLVGLTLTALAGTARADDVPPATPGFAPADVGTPVATAAPADEAPRRPRKLEIAAYFLPMSYGKIGGSAGGFALQADAAFAYGAALSVRYTIWRGLSVGASPQLIYKVVPKDPMDQDAFDWHNSHQLDLLGRVAYTFRPVESIGLYVEVLPGFSTVTQDNGSGSSGFVLGGGVGCMMDMSDRLFVDVGMGYQRGYQKADVTATRVNPDTMMMETVMSKVDATTKYIRVALGVGWRF
jgi:hypothetical protein